MISEHELLDMMFERARKRQTKSDYYIGDLPQLRDLPTRTIIGLTSYFQTVEHNRFILPLSVVDIGFGQQTQSEIARDYLSVKYARRPAIRLSQLPELTKPRNAPQYCRPTEQFEGVYIDLKSAYWSILKLGGWDVDYMPFKWLSRRSTVNDFPAPQLKVARNTLVSLSRQSHLTIWTGNKLIQEKAPAQFLNSALWAFTMDVLHSIAFEMKQIGALYINCDGYILPVEKEAQAFDVIRSWGLEAGIKGRGEAYIKAVGVYGVGNHQSKHKNKIMPSYWDNVYGDYKDWLKPRFQWLTRL